MSPVHIDEKILKASYLDRLNYYNIQDNQGKKSSNKRASQEPLDKKNLSSQRKRRLHVKYTTN